MTVVVLTSGTSYTIPSDWTSTNQIETWGSGAGGGGALTTNAVGSGGGGSGGYSSVSNVTGLSGSLTISIGVAGTAGASTNTAGGNGNPTWFNGATQAASTVSANGGTGGAPSQASGNTAGGAGATTTGATGTTRTAGSVGGDGSGSRGWAGGGAGAPGPDGAGGVGNTGGVANIAWPGDGGVGDNGLGGAAGVHGQAPPDAPPNGGGAGGSNANGGGGGGGAADQGGTGGGPGGNGGLPGGGGGGQSALTTSGAGGAGGGGQIRITYTPTIARVSLVSTQVPVQGPFQLQKGPASPLFFDYYGWQRSPLSKNTVMGYMWTAVPVGPFNPFNYIDWKQAPQGAPTNSPSLVYDVPVTTWKTRGHPVDTAGWSQSPIPREFLVPLPSTSVPKGVYNSSAFQDWQRTPQPPGIQPGVMGTSWSLPLTLDPRISYSGVQSGPQPKGTQVPQPLPWTTVPQGIWSIAAYQSHANSYQRAEFAAPLSVTDVPKGAVLYDYSGWRSFQPPIPGPVPIQSSRSTDLPSTSALADSRKSVVYFQGSQGSPSPAAVLPGSTVCWLPLVYVGNTPIAGGNQSIDARQGAAVHSLPPVGTDRNVYSGFQSPPVLASNALSFTSSATDVPRSTQSDVRWNYTGVQVAPSPPDNAGGFGSRSTTVPRGVKDDGRWSYRGTQQSPQPPSSILSATTTSFFLPVPSRRHDFTGFQSPVSAATPNVLLGPLTIQPLIFSSNVAAVPSGIQSNPKWDYRGTQAAPQPAPSIEARPRFWWQMPDSHLYNRKFDYTGTQVMPLRSTLLMLGPMFLGVPAVPAPMTALPVSFLTRGSYVYLGGQRGPSRWE